MRPAFAILAAAVLARAALGWADVAAAAASPEAVEISQDGGPSLKAMLYRPDGQGPFPAVVALHNCTGLVNRNGALGSRYRDWGERLSKSGFVVLLPDSNASRGLGNQCNARSALIRADRERVTDAIAARVWLQTQGFVAPDRVSVLGWSSGAVAALWAVRVRPQADEGRDFRSAVAFYPGCRRLSNAAWSARVPTLILIGRLDDQSSAAACQRMVAGARGRSAKVAIHVYPGAHHDFDHPNRPLQMRTGLAFTTDGTGRGHSGTDARARADAVRRVPEFLKR